MGSWLIAEVGFLNFYSTFIEVLVALSVDIVGVCCATQTIVLYYFAIQLSSACRCSWGWPRWAPPIWAPPTCCQRRQSPPAVGNFGRCATSLLCQFFFRVFRMFSFWKRKDASAVLSCVDCYIFIVFNNLIIRFLCLIWCFFIYLR